MTALVPIEVTLDVFEVEDATEVSLSSRIIGIKPTHINGPDKIKRFKEEIGVEVQTVDEVNEVCSNQE